MLTVFWDWKGILYEKYIPYEKGEDVVEHWYFDT